jgi:nitroimidazol reductase NimA-like FMN-containing flavoprotein (pyridoxamine 5'-phosphate oxidase superfamily)
MADRNGMEVLGRDECLRLIAEAPVGRVAMVVGGVPVVLPVNFALLQGDVVFRTGTGTKLVAAVERSALTLEVDSIDVDTRTGWSVLVTGGASEITRPDELAAAAALDLQSWVPGLGRYIRIRSVAVSGRRLG